MKPITLSNNLKKLICLLSDHEFHSGTDIGNSLGLTRSGIWKLIKQLTALGIKIDSVTNKGYKTEDILEFLDREKIRKCLSATRLKSLDHFFIFDSIGSTNDYLATHAKQFKNTNAVCFAEHQTTGRGRLGRTWVSPFLSNIYMSLLWNFHFDIASLAGLNIVAGIALAKTIQKITKIPNIQLKWPNDVMWNNFKLGGILIDIIGEYNGLCSVVIGIGLNVNMNEHVASNIEKPWTAINRITNETVSRNILAGTLLDTLIAHLTQFAHSGLSKLTPEWNQLDYLAGKLIKIATPAKFFAGVAKGIDENGALLLENKNGSLITVNSGDASLTDM